MPSVILFKTLLKNTREDYVQISYVVFANTITPPKKIGIAFSVYSFYFLSAAMSQLGNNHKLILIKSVHTLIWLFYNVVIFYVLYAAIANRIDKWVWIGVGFVIIEGIVLLIFKRICPVK